MNKAEIAVRVIMKYMCGDSKRKRKPKSKSYYIFLENGDAVLASTTRDMFEKFSKIDVDAIQL